MSNNSSSALSILKSTAVGIGKIIAYGVAWFFLTIILGAVFITGFGVSEDPAAIWGMVVSALTLGTGWAIRRGWITWSSEDKQVGVSSEMAVMDRNSSESDSSRAEGRSDPDRSTSFDTSHAATSEEGTLGDDSRSPTQDKPNAEEGRMANDQKVSRDRGESSVEWYWSKRGSDEQNGPVDWERLKELAEEGKLEEKDFVWKEGMDEWKRADSIKELGDLVSSPPPLPHESSEVEGTRSKKPPQKSDHVSDDDGEDRINEGGSSKKNKYSGSSLLKNVAIPSVLGIILLFGVSSMYDSGDASNFSVSGSNTVTYDEFQRVEDGMYYSQVEDIVGESGTKVSSSEVDGFGEFSGVSTNMYKWQNSDGSNMVVVFQNNEVMSKSQFGLR
jgi:hypothetical protein